MKPITATVTVELTLEQVNYINGLIARDTAKPMTERKLNNGDTFYKCPVCGKPIGLLIEDDPFCRRCGQRIDQTNIAL